MGKWLATIGSVLVFISTNALALSPSNDDYLKAEKLLNKGQYSQFQQTLKDISKHPLTPYLEARWLRSQFYKKPIAEIDDFLHRYDQQQPALQLQKQWVSYLASKQEWALFLHYYQPTSNLSLQCQRIKALENTKRQFDAIKDGQEIWLLGVSLPKACDQLYKDWERYGYLSQDLIWQRYLKAVPKKQYKLVRYLRRKLDDEYQTKADLVQNFWRHPEQVFISAEVLTLAPQVRHLLLTKALKKQPELFGNPRHADLLDNLDADQLQELQHISFKQLAINSPSDSFEWYELAKRNNALNQEVEEAFLQGAIKKENWPLYTHLFKLSDSHIKQEPKWQYWQGRALSILGAPSSQSRQFYEQASIHREFYGFLSSQQLGISATMNHNPTHVPASVLQSMRLLPGIKRALAFYELGRVAQARREWQNTFDQQEEIGKQALAILAGRFDWSDRAIMSLAQIKSWHDLQLRFPLVHDQLFEKAAQKNQINKNWIYGIARQESAFMQDARSPVGATGLMQIMPSTARSISRRMRIKYSKNRLVEPSYNIQLGSHYLQFLLKKYDGNRILATAAYNAGPGNVKRWMKTYQGPLDIWIEQIPFNETKEYVQRVLTYSTIYSYRLGYLQPILDDTTISAWAQMQPEDLKISKANIEQNSKG